MTTIARTNDPLDLITALEVAAPAGSRGRRCFTCNGAARNLICGTCWKACAKPETCPLCIEVGAENHSQDLCYEVLLRMAERHLEATFA